MRNTQSLFAATQETLREWIDRFTSEAAERLP